MNHAYRLVFNRALNAWVAVAEIAKSCCKGGRGGKSAALHLAPPSTAPAITRDNGAFLLRTLSVALASAFSFNAFALDPGALPSGGQVTAGSGTISQSGTTMTVTQTSQNLAINWPTYIVGVNATVNYVQPNSSAIALNRITGSDPSLIYGHINANGQVFLLNPNGILFGKTAQVNVGGLVATTLGLSDADFMARNYRFSGTAGSVLNQGAITAADGGYVALLGGQVSNQGTLVAKLGNVSLAAGSDITLDFVGDSLISLTVTQGALNALAENKQLIQADGGTVLLTAKAADSLIQAVVNNEGVIEARTVANQNGTIRLMGDMANGLVKVDGTLDASAPTTGNGGFVETSAAHVKVADSARVTTKAANGLTGSWLIDPNDFTVAASGGDMTGTAVSTALASNNFTIQSSSGGSGTNGDIFVNDGIAWTSGTTLTLSAYRNININATIDASVGNGGVALEYGQGASYNFGLSSSGFAGKINLGAGSTFTTQEGSNAVTNYTVITTLGAPVSTTGTDLQGINGNLSGNYVLGADINANATSGWNSNTGFTPLGTLTGILDGLGHTVSHLTLNQPTVGGIGFISQSLGTVSNLGLTDVSIAGHNYVGGLAAINRGSISNSYVTGTVSGGAENVGGLVGINYGGSIRNSYVAGSITSTGNSVGGLAGANYLSAVITDSYTSATVTANGSGTYGIGGLVGNNDAGSTITNSHASGSVTANGSYSYNIGGLAGINSNGSSITDSYASGTVTANGSNSYDIGGLVGLNYSAITNSHAIGAVTAGSGGNDVGGLVGMNNGGTIDTSYATGAVTVGNDGGYVGSLAGYNSGTITDSYATGAIATGSNSSYIGALVGYSQGSITNSYYKIDSVTINGQPVVSSNGLYATQFNDWIANSLSFLPITHYYTANGQGFYQVGTLQDLKNLLAYAPTNNSAYKFVLTANIDLTSVPNFTIPLFAAPQLDGAGHVLSHLTLNNPTGQYVGFIGTLANGSSISNLGLTGVNVTGYSTVGGLVGANYGSIGNSYVTGTVTGFDQVGGLVGLNGNQGSISNSYAMGTVTGSVDGNGYAGSVGGLVGTNSHGSISNSRAAVAVSSSGQYGRLGGLVGLSFGDTISNSYASGAVSGGAGAYGGGLVGFTNSGSVSNSYATGPVSVGNSLGGYGAAGGLVGAGGGAAISNSYASGAVSGGSGAPTGGLVGLGNNVTTTHSFWNTQTSGRSTSAGSGAVGKTTAELQQLATFTAASWDIVSDSAVLPGSPVLRSATPGASSGTSIWILGTKVSAAATQNQNTEYRNIVTSVQAQFASTPSPSASNGHRNDDNGQNVSTLVTSGGSRSVDSLVLQIDPNLGTPISFETFRAVRPDTLDN